MAYTRWDGKEVEASWPEPDSLRGAVFLLTKAVNKPAKDIDWQDVRYLVDKASQIVKGHGY